MVDFVVNFMLCNTMMHWLKKSCYVNFLSKDFYWQLLYLANVD